MSDDALDVIVRTAEVCANYLNEDYGVDLMKAHTQLLAEREAAAKDREDAERYRYLRDPKRAPGDDELWVALGHGFLSQWSGRPLDDLIDAARIQP